MIDLSRLKAAYETAKADLLAERTPDGHWVGELSTSALSTATAVSALAIHRRVCQDEERGADAPGDAQSAENALHKGDLGSRCVSEPLARLSTHPTRATKRVDHDSLISGGIAWLVAHQNDDGGFGDTDKSYSNIATTMLVVAAIHLAGHEEKHKELLGRAEKYIDSKGRLKGLRERYGVDKTFVVPIMTNLALAGLVEWKEVSSLPFELACVPQSWYRFMRMPVVSYAIPALVAIGQCRYFHQKPWNPVARLVRSLSVSRSLNVLRQMQPESGGYLEAVPLTSFVVMSLASTGRQDHAVTREGIKFLVDSVRPDGSWPIDTNLATWVTTLSINALASGGEDVAALLGPQCLDWLLSCQHLTRHPFTGADPGGWGWSDLSGAVPDADDTPGALLALDAWRKSKSCTEDERERATVAAMKGFDWLVGLQNRDGGWPTFCRGWGKLPFDRSGPDLTAHVLRAYSAWDDKFPLVQRTYQDWWMMSPHEQAPTRGMTYLRRKRWKAICWIPLWFGNQDERDETNKVYGTAKTLMLIAQDNIIQNADELDPAELEQAAEALKSWTGDIEEAKKLLHEAKEQIEFEQHHTTPLWRYALEWLRDAQNPDGGWGSGVWGKSGVPSTQYSVLSTQDRVQSAECRVQSAEFGVPDSSPSPQSLAPSPVPAPTSSIEETALAVEALLAAYDNEEFRLTIQKGLTWLVERVERGEHRNAAPIGFYFAKLWYYEKLYPLAFTVSALGRAVRMLAPD